MRILYQVRVGFLSAFVIILSACKSDADKQQDAIIACYEANHPGTADQRAHDADPQYRQTPAEREATVARISMELQAKCAKAQRVASH